MQLNGNLAWAMEHGFGVLIFDLFALWKSKRRGKPGFSEMDEQGNQNLSERGDRGAGTFDC